MPPTEPAGVEPAAAEDLGACLARRGPLPLEEVVRVGVAVAAQLAELHGEGVVFGELRPEAIRVAGAGAPTGDEAPVLRRAAPPEASAAQNGDAPSPPLVSLLYGSPEHILGRPLDARSDLWSLGAVLYRALLGSPPFAGEDRETLTVSVTQRSFPSPSSIDPSLPAAVDVFFRRALRKDAVERFQTADELRAALEQLLVAGRQELKAATPAPGPELVRPEPAVDSNAEAEPKADPMWKGAVERSLIVGAILLFVGALAFANRDAIFDRLDAPFGADEGAPQPAELSRPVARTDKVGPVRLEGPQGHLTLPLDRPFIMNVWLERCEDCMPSFEAWRRLADAGELPALPVVNVAYGRADPAWAERYSVSERLVFDPGDNVVRPLGITRFTTLIVASDGKVLYAGAPKDPGFAEALAEAVKTLKPD